MIFGKKGCGKTTLLTKIALQYLKKGIPVYSTEPIPGCFIISPEDVGFYVIPENSVLLIDEVGMIWDNRKHKDFKTEVRDWFKLQRHHKVTVFLFSQAFDIDKKLRDLTDDMYLVEKKFRVFSYAKRIMKRVVLNESTAESSSKLDENLMFDSFLMFWAGSRKFTFIPKYIKYFDSFAIPKLSDKKFELIPAFKSTKPKLAFSLHSLSSFFPKPPTSPEGEGRSN
ncbi:MAG: ATP-binding protein [Oscillospiraceae bacterium]